MATTVATATEAWGVRARSQTPRGGSMYTSRERVMRAVRGDSVDRVPWTLYRHFYEEEATAEQLAKNTVAWNERWGFDVVKVQPRAAYYGEDWGAEWRNAGDPPRPARVKFPVETGEDWEKIKTAEIRGSTLGAQKDGG